MTTIQQHLDMLMTEAHEANLDARMNTIANTETTQLSHIYIGLIDDLEVLMLHDFNAGRRARAMQLVSDAFDEAFGVRERSIDYSDLEVGS